MHIKVVGCDAHDARSAGIRAIGL